MQEYEEGFGHTFYDMADFLSELQLTETWPERSVLRLDDGDFSRLAEVVYRVGNVLFCIEEVDLYATPHEIDHWLSRLVRHGRHRAVELLVVSRRPAEISRHLTANADEIFVGQFHEPRDLLFFRELGLNDEIMPEQFHFVSVNTSSGERRLTNTYIG